MREGYRVSVVIPALNEAQAIEKVLAAVPAWVDEIVVADNGSTDNTAELARASGARIVSEPEKGYGAACQAGLGAVSAPDVIVFLDADFSDHPDEMHRLVDPITRGEADLVIGSRVLGNAEAGALTPQQRFGNWLATRLIRLIWGQRFTDLGPFRAIRRSSLDELQMTDRDFGWTVEMQIKAAQKGLRCREQPVSYRRRIGHSKISGTLMGTFRAGRKILALIAFSAWRDMSARLIRVGPLAREDAPRHPR